MNAIQTKYNGRFYRSRLEARYAVLFDACPLAYDYENEGFELDQSRCHVDFWLPTLGIFFEVKGSLLVGWRDLVMANMELKVGTADEHVLVELWKDGEPAREADIPDPRCSVRL